VILAKPYIFHLTMGAPEHRDYDAEESVSYTHFNYPIQ